MYQSGRAGDEAKKRKSSAKSRRVGITANSGRGRLQEVVVYKKFQL